VPQAAGGAGARRAADGEHAWLHETKRFSSVAVKTHRTIELPGHDGRPTVVSVEVRAVFEPASVKREGVDHHGSKQVMTSGGVSSVTGAMAPALTVASRTGSSAARTPRRILTPSRCCR
jgi:hypothetical protein